MTPSFVATCPSGLASVSSVVLDVVSSSSIETHARIVMQKFIMRELIRQSGDIISEAYEENTDVFDLLDKAESNLYEITDNHLRKNFNSISTIVMDTLKEIQEQRESKEDLTGIPSGFRDLDAITGGWQKTDLIILAATCDHPPGAAPRSTTLKPAFKI